MRIGLQVRRQWLDEVDVAISVWRLCLELKLKGWWTSAAAVEGRESRGGRGDVGWRQGKDS